MRNAHLWPIDGIVLLPDVVLIARDVDTIDAFLGVGKPLAQEAVVFPLAHTDTPSGIDVTAETVALAVLPLSVVIASLTVDVHTVAFAFAVFHFSCIDKLRQFMRGGKRCFVERWLGEKSGKGTLWGLSVVGLNATIGLTGFLWPIVVAGHTECG